MAGRNDLGNRDSVDPPWRGNNVDYEIASLTDRYNRTGGRRLKNKDRQAKTPAVHS